MGALPLRKDLATATISVLKNSCEPMKAATINDAVAKLLDIPSEVLMIEDANCTGSEYSYQMRWIRTDLKKRGLL